MENTRTSDVSRSKVPSRIRRVLRQAGRNTLLLMAGLVLIGLAGEAWFRITTPFVGGHFPRHFVPNVGVLGKPHAEVRKTDGRDYWTISRTNSLGFLDREPISPERAAASCHVTMIGDSFVEAAEVAVADKFHVRLEALAARELPHLDITTSAFGRFDTGQIQQLPLYDEYARHLHPKLLVLVVYLSDFSDNSTLLYALYRGWDPERMPFASAARDEDGKIRLRPPHPDYMAARGAGPLGSAARTLNEGWKNVLGASLFVDWVYLKAKTVFYNRIAADQATRAESLSRLPHYAPLLDGLRPLWSKQILRRILNDPMSTKEDLPPILQDALDTMAFALDQFKMRADRDGAALVILATDALGASQDGRFDWLNAMAGARDIPVINLYDHIIRRGGRTWDARWPHDMHWNPTGHRWAAEALLEYLKRHPETCDRAVAAGTH